MAQAFARVHRSSLCSLPCRRSARCAADGIGSELEKDFDRTNSGHRISALSPKSGRNFVPGFRARNRARNPAPNMFLFMNGRILGMISCPESGHEIEPGFRQQGAQFGGLGIICGQRSLWPRTLNLESPWPEGWPWHGSLLSSAGRARPLPRAPALSRLFETRQLALRLKLPSLPLRVTLSSNSLR